MPEPEGDSVKLNTFIHELSDEMLYQALSQVLRSEFGEDLIPCEGLFDKLARALPSTPHRVLHRMVAEIVKDEVLLRWKTAIAARQRQEGNVLRLPKDKTIQQLHGAERDRIMRRRR